MTGAGDDFCAGWGGPWPVRSGPREWDPVYWEGKRLLTNLLDIEVPMISAVNGPATFHAEIPVLSDVVLASENAFFQTRPTSLRQRARGWVVQVVWPLLLGENPGTVFSSNGTEAIGPGGPGVGGGQRSLAAGEAPAQGMGAGGAIRQKPPLTLRYTG